jgi:cell wall-associated NlpC family hydrolase
MVAVKFSATLRCLIFSTWLLALSACSLVRESATPPVQDIGAKIATSASLQLGAPYRFGGDSPQGFDCSGLVRYVFEQHGIAVPRTAQDQQRAAQPVAADSLQPGDLVFFRVSGGAIDHVGIYVGEGAFVHAPRTGKPVRQELLGDNYYQRRYAGAGRLWR